MYIAITYANQQFSCMLCRAITILTIVNCHAVTGIYLHTCLLIRRVLHDVHPFIKDDVFGFLNIKAVLINPQQMY